MIIKNQAQMVFQSFFMVILDLKIPVREQLEILYVKCVLKPLIHRIQTLKENQQKALIQINPQSPVKDGKDLLDAEVLSDQDDADQEDTT